MNYKSNINLVTRVGLSGSCYRIPPKGLGVESCVWQKLSWDRRTIATGKAGYTLGQPNSPA